EIIRMLAQPHNNICVVGDDSQTIFSFRGASWKYMVNFNQVYPNCTSIVMDINYRSTPSIVGLGNSIIHRNEKQIKKTLKSVIPTSNLVKYATPLTSDIEADEIVSDIQDKRNMGLSLAEISVIYRTHATGRAIFDKLLLADIPFVTYGKSNESFYQNTFIRPVMALLRVTVNSSDMNAIEESAPLFYISKADMRRTLEEIVMNYNGEIPKELFKLTMKKIADTKSGFQQRQLITKMDAVQKLKSMTTPAAIREIRKGTFGYESQLEVDGRKTISIAKEMMLEILDEFEQASRGFKDIQAFLTFVARVEEKNAEMEELRNQPDIQAVRLMTIHASKGLEFDVVYAIGWSEGILPHAASLDTEKKEDSPLPPEEAIAEERRLAYVCVTRARQHLYISSPQNHRNEKVHPSRFIVEGMGMESIHTKKEGRKL
ncbi:MAG: ATP-dependent helicase, partial [Melioribacteraceae bacterium]|nr:ATP-dependent helicase [Melioribacteraceae bacterium]